MPIESVKPNGYNPNEVPDSVFQFLKQSIKKRGFVAPIIVTQDLTIIDGEHRWKAMKESGATEIEVKVLDLTDEEARAETINFNLTRGEFNQEKLAVILRELTKDKVAEEIEQMLVMRQKEIAKIVAKHTESGTACHDPSSEFKQVETTIERGDIITIGNHRVMCGDSSSVADVVTLMDGRRATLVVTSPPYYNQRDYSQWATYPDYLAFIDAVIRGVREAVDPASSIVCWNVGSAEKDHEFIPADHYMQFRQAGFTWVDWIVWQKDCAQWNNRRSQHIDNGLYIPAIRWESICVFMMGDRPKFDIADLKQVKTWQENLWLITEVKGVEQRKVGHPAMYPIEIPYRCVLSYTQRDAVVFDPFGGSGQTLLACEQTGRRCCTMEMEPKFCEIIVQRWEQMTGRKRE